MMRLRAACAMLVLFALCKTSTAALPPREQIERDLAGPLHARQADPALTHRGEIAQRVERVILRQARFVAQSLRPWEHDTRALLLTDGKSNEPGIRPNTQAIYGFAALYRAVPDDSDAVFTRAAARDRAIAMLRFILPTHGAGGMTCADGKPWKNHWQSAHWATSAGQAAWLMWDDLDPELKWLAARMICDEADRFIDQPPPAQIERDTKAEENAWNAQVIALAYNMFPNHPRHDHYRDAAIVWSLNSFARAADMKRDDRLDGKPIKEWLKGTGPNLHDDYTLENHDRVHPDYMNSTRSITYQKLMYDWAGNPAPESLRFSIEPIYAILKKLSLPDGGYVYPNAQDWHLHRNADWLDVHAMMATVFRDPQAARLMRNTLETAERMLARSDDGGIYAPGETFFASSQQMLLDLYADAYLLLRQEGDGVDPVEPATLWRDLAGTHVFETGKFALVRTDHSIATFSWGRQVMGMVLPLRPDLLLTPNPRSLIGVVETNAKEGKSREAPVVKQAVTSTAGGGFAICGLLDRGAGMIEQRFAFVALPDGRTVYADSLRLTGNEKPSALNLGTLGVLNDVNWVYHDGNRTLVDRNGHRPFPAKDAKEAKPLELSSPWYNLDGLGIVCLKTNGKQVYAAEPSPVRARLEQLFHLNAIDVKDVPSSGAPIAQTVLVFYPAQDAGDTGSVAERCKLRTVDEHGRMTVSLEDGQTISIDLIDLKVNVTRPG